MPQSNFSSSTGRTTVTPGTAQRILIVDDEALLREALAYALRDEGYVTLEAANGREAVERVASERPDLVLMDVMMPVLDGRQALHLIRSAQPWAMTPVVMMSAAVGRELLDASIAGYLAKPFDIDRLIQLVVTLIGRPPSSGPGG